MGQFFSGNNNITFSENKHYTINSHHQINSHHPMIFPEKKTVQIKSDDPVKSTKQKYKIGENLEIKFINSFNESIGEKEIEKFRCYNKIIFGYSFNQLIGGKIPGNVIFIQFGHNFNKSIEMIVIENEEDNIQELVLGEKFDQPVNNISPNLKKITFGYDFNQSVENLPNKLEYIKFGNNFNKCIDYLPCSLTNIIFGNNFNQSVDNLPTSVILIGLSGQNFDLPITNLPIGLKKINLNKIYYEKNKNKIDEITNDNEFVEISY
jgi:hypothetical protein